MNKKRIFIVGILVLVIAGCICFTRFLKNEEIINDESKKESEIIEQTDFVQIPIDSVSGITTKKAEELCYNVLGKKDEKTGNLFSYGVSDAVKKGNREYYIVRVSWLVNNDHMSYIGDFFVSSDGSKIYNGFAKPGEYEMGDIIWSK